MKRHDKTYWLAWVLLLVYVPMVVLSSLDFHHEWEDWDDLCQECLEHHIHNGLITVAKAHDDCLLCVFRGNVYQTAEEQHLYVTQTVICQTIDIAVPALELGVSTHQNTRAPPFTFCA